MNNLPDEQPIPPSPRVHGAPKTLLGGRRPLPAHVTVYLFVIVPFLALIAAVPVAWGWGLSWTDMILAAVWYTVTCLGVTVGYHRHFTHGSFKAKRPLRLALAVAGGLAVQGPILHWVADHRRHHAFSDKDGDPHSPWLFGTSPAALARGFWHRLRRVSLYDALSCRNTPIKTTGTRVCRGPARRTGGVPILR
jgi:fatty-acid desaturase